MSRNGPFALLFHTLVVLFMLAPLVVVCLVAFTPENTLSLPTTEFSLRWFRAVFERADFVDAFYNSLILAQDADYVWREVQYALSRQEPFELNYRIRCADHSIKHVWEKGVGIYSDTREVLGIEGAIFERNAGH